MKDKLDTFIKVLEQDMVSCIIPGRKGLRKMIKNHVFHDHAEIFLQTAGKTVFSFPHEEVELEEGAILIVPPELPHAEKIFRCNNLFETIVITPYTDALQCHISRESNLGIPTILYYETVKNKDNIRIRQYTDLLIEGGMFTDNLSRMITKGLSLALVAQMRRLLAEGEEIPAENSKVREVKNTVLSRYHHSSLNVSQLAEQLNCTADYLSWLFHRETGCTLNRFINQIRLKKAADLLKNTDYTISEIAWICGYKNPAYFSRVFSGEFQFSPREYRES
ncbi:MAG: helix-turn-helix transcriptional regulator [Spirochaetaceae bacterium]|nr:helix-turn-helix transcriptional regulator [Spirochaetaceae bacterium]